MSHFRFPVCPCWPTGRAYRDTSWNKVIINDIKPVLSCLAQVTVPVTMSAYSPLTPLLTLLEITSSLRATVGKSWSQKVPFNSIDKCMGPPLTVDRAKNMNVEACLGSLGVSLCCCSVFGLHHLLRVIPGSFAAITLMLSWVSHKLLVCHEGSEGEPNRSCGPGNQSNEQKDAIKLQRVEDFRDGW